jgi:hypothetical protein
MKMAKRLIDDYLEGDEWRSTVRNWPEDVKAVVDGYRAHTVIPHAVQKDAIQNGWSARRKKNGDGWSFEFEVIDSGPTDFLLMTDSGTTGLTGKILTNEEYELDLPPEERWGRFEGVAFTQPRSERTIGSRGRGKFIFVGASKDFTIFYDTLRNDGIYRFGSRTVKKTSSPVAAWDGDEGREKIKKFTQGTIEPLSKVGTRVIIVNPLDELLDDIVHDRFLRYIGETWWEIILKYGAKIKVKGYGREQMASIPREFSLKENDSDKFKVWTKNNHKARSGAASFYIKKFHIICRLDEAVPEDIRGIAIQRDGMKVCTIEAKYMPKDIAEKLYGYIKLDAETEERLLVDEDIEHYDFDFRKSLPGAIRRFVEDEILKFAKEKLNYGVDIKEIRRQHQQNAERRALVAANTFVKGLGIGMGPGNIGNGNGGERHTKKLRIHMDELSLPRPNDLRVNYGEKVDNIRIKVINDGDSIVKVILKIALHFAREELKSFVEEEIVVPSGSSSSIFELPKQVVTENDFPNEGRYTIVAIMYSKIGEKLDRKSKSFYVEQDPPMRGLFERCEAFEVPTDEEPLKYWMGYSDIGSERGLILNYNIGHPGYAPIAENVNDLAEYILRIAGQEICRYDLMQEQPVIFKAEPRDDPQEILKEERRVVGEIVYKFRTGVI